MKAPRLFLAALLFAGQAAGAALPEGATALTIQGVTAAWGLAHHEGFLYVSDGETDEIVKFDASGQLVARFGGSGDQAGAFHSPNGLAFGPDGHLYVADYANHRVQVLDTDGAPVLEFGSLGSAPGELTYPSDLGVDQDGMVYVLDSFNSRVCVFGPRGTFEREFGASGEGALQDPMGMALGPQGDLYIADAGRDQVVRFTTAGDFVAAYGVPGSGQGQFGDPMDVAVDQDGSMIVADLASQRVQVLDPNGAFVGWWGQGAAAATFQEPYAVELGPDGRILLADGSGPALYALARQGQAASADWMLAAAPAAAGSDAKTLSFRPDAIKPASLTGSLVVGPVPSRSGEPLCAYLPQAPKSATWALYSVDGRKVGSADYSGQAQQCYGNTGSLVAGVYFVTLDATWADGTKSHSTQKIVVRN